MTTIPKEIPQVESQIATVTPSDVSIQSCVSFLPETDTRNQNFDSFLLSPEFLHHQIQFKERAFNPDLPSEQMTSRFLGILVHFGPLFLFLLSYYYTNNIIGSSLSVMTLNLILILLCEHFQPAINLPPVSLKEIWDGLVLVFLTGYVLGNLVIIAGWFILASLYPTVDRHFSMFTITLAVLFDDYCYYWYHRALSHGQISNFYQEIHRPHHAISHLDFYRGNISSVADTAILGFQVPLIVISFLYKMDLASTLVSYIIILLLQATHHVNHTFDIGKLRFIFVDNHAHKLHHCPWGNYVNFGACFSMWDRNLGTFYEDWNFSSNYGQEHKCMLAIKRTTSSPRVQYMTFVIFSLFLIPIFSQM